MFPSMTCLQQDWIEQRKCFRQNEYQAKRIEIRFQSLDLSSSICRKWIKFIKLQNMTTMTK
jgi:hypothetical protein